MPGWLPGPLWNVRQGQGPGQARGAAGSGHTMDMVDEALYIHGGSRKPR